MRILFTGGSSFTGMWFIHELLLQGHQITAIFQSPLDTYQGIRKQRVYNIFNRCNAIFGCSFGSELFLGLLKMHRWDILCHHAAEVTAYKRPDFDVVAALANNTCNLRHVLQAMRDNGCQHLLLTGSVFEQNEGVCNSAARAISPYGLSKGLTSEVFAYYCQEQSIAFGKFVIANPFGPLEEDRFTSYLAKQWLQGGVPEVKCPEYTRDNIPVTFLAKAYAHFAQKLCLQTESMKVNPSFRPETQKEFATRFAMEIEKRFHLPCPLHFHAQTEFHEPQLRINQDRIDVDGWNEKSFWDELAHFYMANHAVVHP